MNIYGFTISIHEVSKRIPKAAQMADSIVH